MAQSAGSRPRSKTPRGVLQVDWAFFGELCRVLALKIFREYDPDVVIGIARAGVIPGAVVASILQRDFASVAITRQETGARPVVMAGPPRPRAPRPRLPPGGTQRPAAPTETPPHP